MVFRSAARRRVEKGSALCLLLSLFIFLLSACGGNPQTQQQASKNKQALDTALAQARNIGVPANLLQPIMQQEQQLTVTHAPLSLFGDQPVEVYYQDLAMRYSQLLTQVTGLETQITQQFDYQASQALQTMSNALAERQDQNFVEAQTFANELTTYQQALAKAQYPKDYARITAEAQSGTQALHLMGPAYDALTSFQKVIKQLQSSNIDVTGFTQEAQDDLQSFKNATKPADFIKLIDLINSQLNETTTVSTVAIPYVGQVKLNQFGNDIQLIKQYDGMDVSLYEHELQTDQQDLNSAKTVSDFLRVSAQIDADIASIQLPLSQAQANYLLQKFQDEVKSWGATHQYHDSFNGQSYPLDYEYDVQGIGSDATAAVQSAQTLDDYQSAIDLINNDLLHLQMMEQDYADNTPYNQPHQEDFTLMNHYGIANASEVLVVSLVEQTLRYYQYGKLVRAFHITSGQYALPSPPGYWQIIDRESPTVFKSSEPKGSAFWYPDTKINFAMEYHAGGYFFHDSWWRVNYGVGTNFPHYDTGGDEAFAGDGSHGCINMAENDIAWLYPNTDYNAKVILY
ncbi:MAG TPA: L,D-transpeptidase [Ktedonobacteraceae bacterium]|nr:L,D-transpeptidase [Ktedonobacteraceae bacterium]